MTEHSHIEPITTADLQTTLRVLHSVDLLAHRLHTGSGSRGANNFSTTYNSPLDPAISYIRDFTAIFGRITGDTTPNETDTNPGARR